MAIAQQSIDTSATTVYDSSGTNAITAIYFMNDHSSSVTVQVHVVLDGDSADSTNKIIKDLIISAGDTYVIDTERLVLGDSDTIQASASVSNVVHATLSYIGV
jgi:hypothetical protein